MMLRNVAVAVLVGTVCLSIWSQREGMVAQWHADLRELKAQRLQATRALNILKDNATVVSAVALKPATTESLTLSLVEMVKRRSVSLDAQLTSLSVTDSNESNASSERVNGALYSLSVEIDVVLHRAIDLLQIFDAVREVAGWRPIEVRNCSLVRAGDRSRLRTFCTIDVYYFPGIDT